ncbi:hypothetical protein [Deinococcus multiflagellatus]|uniref:hypothetical protein n=1 Tax=Deinococcus multiflagellatus TaxID=1656887 RepID=UPI001CCC9BDF|nr:hypothetical protein [Deinococcus multiflagellatus]MBZ9713794.1 hypothetical protein [Deinococcus multiflagellatus]
MNRTPAPPTPTSPPLKAALAIELRVLGDTQPRLYPVASLEGKRRLFSHRAWAERTCEGWLRVLFAPGWLITRPSGVIEHVTNAVCPDEPGAVERVLADMEARYCVHLWVAPIKLPRNVEPFGQRYRAGACPPNDHALEMAQAWGAA